MDNSPPISYEIVCVCGGGGSAPLRMQTCHEVQGGGETLSLRRFHRNAAAAPSLLSQEAVGFNSINADVSAQWTDIEQRRLASVGRKRLSRTRVGCGRGGGGGGGEDGEGGISIKHRSNVRRSRAPRKQSRLWYLPAKYCRQGHSFASIPPPTTPPT